MPVEMALPDDALAERSRRSGGIDIANALGDVGSHDSVILDVCGIIVGDRLIKTIPARGIETDSQ